MTARYDYVTVGHVTRDLIEDRPVDTAGQVGGSAFYSALQASRLGLRTLIFTQGVAGELHELLAPYLGELDLHVIPAEHTTTLATVGAGASRSQRMLTWAGAMVGPLPELDTAILHLAPVARETPSTWSVQADFVGMTPQGLVRRWAQDGEVFHSTLDPSTLPPHFDAAVIGEQELDSCGALFAAARSAGASVAVTAGARATTVHLPGDDPSSSLVQAAVPSSAPARDDLGAGDVFAAAFFVALHEGRDVHAAAAFANAAGALRVASSGAGAIGDRAAIEALARGRHT